MMKTTNLSIFFVFAVLLWAGIATAQDEVAEEPAATEETAEETAVEQDPAQPAAEADAQAMPAQDEATEPAATEETAEEPAVEVEEDESFPEPVQAAPAQIEEVVVTGSRIRRDAFTGALPITIITEERALLAGLADTSEILQSSALASGTQIDNSFGGFVVSGGPGANTFGLRSLDADRTLVLLNGRRFTAAGTRGQVSSVDLSSIPFVAIDRIEILKDGASSIYGADAVAGVVNIITKRRIDGLTIEGSYTDKRDYGYLEALYGKTWDRGYFDFAISTSISEVVGRDEQDWSYCSQRPLTNGNVHPSAYSPTGNGECFGSINGIVDVYGLGPTMTFIQDPEADYRGAGLPWRRATYGLDGGRMAEAGYREERNWSDEGLLPRRELLHIYSDGLLDLNLGEALGAVSAGYEFYYSRRQDTFHGGHRQFFPFVHPANPTNPFGVLRATAQPVVMAYDLLDPVTEVENDVTAFRFALEGDRGDFSWNFDLGYSWSEGEWNYDTLLKDKVARALSSALDANGNLQCVLSPAQLNWGSSFESAVVQRVLQEGPDANCVPLNLFTTDALRSGIIPQDAADYITEQVKLRTDYDLLNASFNLEGRLFDLPAGTVRGAFGLEWRERELDDRPPLASVEDNQWGFTGAGRTRGNDQVKEAFAEMEFPLLAGRSLAEELTVNTSWRFTDYSSYGSDHTWRVLMNYAMTPAFRIRASRGTSFRAPALYELYLANQTGFASSNADPCSNFRDPSSDLDPDSTIFQNCAALEEQGIIPPDYAATSSILIITGGNLDLKAETSDSFTLGLVATPDFNLATGLTFNFAVDYYNIELANSITRLSAGEVLNRCYGSPNFSAQECTLVGNRRSDGQLEGVNSSYINVSIEESEGFDVTIRADREFSFGDLSVDILAARLLSYEVGFAQGSAPTDYTDRHTYPKWRGEVDVRFDWRDYTFSWSTDFIGATEEEPVYRLGSDRSVTNISTAENKLFHSASVRYADPNGRFSVVLGMRNLFNEHPPVVGWGPFRPSVAAAVDFNAPLGGGYDLLGRRVFLSFSYNPLGR